MRVMTTPLRAVATLVLIVQLHQLALPAFCGTADRAPTPCHEAPSPGAPQLVGQGLAHEPACSNAAMCGLSATGILELAIALTAPDAFAVAVLAAPSLPPADPSPPLSPPPQA